MAKKQRKKTSPKPHGKSTAAAVPTWSERLNKTSRKSWVAAFAIAIVFWGGVVWLLSLRDKENPTGKNHRELAIETQLFIQEIGIALANFESVHGTYPACLNETKGAEVLFQKLLAGSERFLGPLPGRVRKGRDGGPSLIVDSWGHPIQYRTGHSSGKPVTPHPDYDLWSTGGDPDNPPEKWILP